MQTWIKKAALTLFGVALIAGGLTACSGRGSHGNWTAESMSKAKTKMVDRAANKLDLDAAQKQKLSALADKVEAQHQAIKGTTDVRTQAAAFVSGAQFDRKGASELVSEKTRLIQAAGPELITAFGDFYDVLKPEQQTKVREMAQKMKR